MALVYIGVGSNIDPETNIPRALQLIKQHVRLTAVSTFYCTDPIGSPHSPIFYDGVVSVETDIPPRDLKFNILRRIETDLGRHRTGDKNAPRPIDLDILLYGNEIINDPDLTIPDPEISHRPFLYHPLLELDPNLTLPTGEQLSNTPPPQESDTMIPKQDFTDSLRELCK